VKSPVAVTVEIGTAMAALLVTVMVCEAEVEARVVAPKVRLEGESVGVAGTMPVPVMMTVSVARR